MSYQALADANYFDHIRIFERDDVPGGNWHHSDEVPNTVPLAEQAVTDWWKSDYEPGAPPAVPHHVVYDIGRNKSAQEELERGRINHRQPKPVWKSLRANTPAPQQQVGQVHLWDADFRFPGFHGHRMSSGPRIIPGCSDISGRSHHGWGSIRTMGIPVSCIAHGSSRWRSESRTACIEGGLSFCGNSRRLGRDATRRHTGKR